MCSLFVYVHVCAGTNGRQEVMLDPLSCLVLSADPLEERSLLLTTPTNSFLISPIILAAL